MPEANKPKEVQCWQNAEGIARYIVQDLIFVALRDQLLNYGISVHEVELIQMDGVSVFRRDLTKYIYNQLIGG